MEYPKEWTALSKFFKRYTDAVEAKLNKDLEAGIVELKSNGKRTYLRAVA